MGPMLILASVRHHSWTRGWARWGLVIGLVTIPAVATAAADAWTPLLATHSDLFDESLKMEPAKSVVGGACQEASDCAVRRPHCDGDGKVRTYGNPASCVSGRCIYPSRRYVCPGGDCAKCVAACSGKGAHGGSASDCSAPGLESCAGVGYCIGTVAGAGCAWEPKASEGDCDEQCQHDALWQCAGDLSVENSSMSFHDFGRSALGGELECVGGKDGFIYRIPCDDGDVCTYDDTWYPIGICVGTPVDCKTIISKPTCSWSSTCDEYALGVRFHYERSCSSSTGECRVTSVYGEYVSCSRDTDGKTCYFRSRRSSCWRGKCQDVVN